MRRLLYASATVTKYRWPVLSELGRRGVHCRLVVAGVPNPSPLVAMPPGTPMLDPVHCPGKGLRFRSDVMKLVKEYRPDVVLLEHGASLDFAWTMLVTKSWVGAPHVLWTHGMNRRDLFKRSGSLASAARWVQLQLADGILCYDSSSAASLRARLPRKTIGVAPNSTDTADLARRRRLLSGEREALRRRFGMKAKYYVVTLGRLIRSKAFHVATRVVSILRRKELDVGLIVVGDGPEMQTIREGAKGQGLVLGQNCHLLGEVTDPQQLVEALVCADICVNPGTLGLSVTDCMAAGVPIVALSPLENGPYHGPELTYVEEGTSGWLVMEHTEEALSQAVEHYLRLPSTSRMEHEEYCITFAEQRLGIEKLVDGMMALLDHVAA